MPGFRNKFLFAVAQFNDLYLCFAGSLSLFLFKNVGLNKNAIYTIFIYGKKLIIHFLYNSYSTKNCTNLLMISSFFNLFSFQQLWALFTLTQVTKTLVTQN